MDSDAIIRDAGKVYSRLFDHRAIISPEIHQFIDEFQTKPAKRESRNLDATLAIVTEMTQTQLPHAELLFDDGIPKLLGSLRVGARMVENIVEKQSSESFDELYEAKKKERTAVENAFLEELCKESDQIEMEYEESKKKMLEHYENLNKQMQK